MSPPSPDFNVTAENSIDALLKTYKNYANSIKHNKAEKQGKEAKTSHSLDKWFKEFKTHVVVSRKKKIFE
jgi:hypothetical protein